MRRGISLLRVYETREEQGILDEENGRVVADEIPDTLFGVELHRKATWIPENKQNVMDVSIMIGEIYVRSFELVACSQWKVESGENLVATYSNAVVRENN